MEIHTYNRICVLIITLISCLISNHPLAQDKHNKISGIRLTNIHYQNSAGEQGLTTLIYDNDGIFRKARWELKDKSRSSENVYTYDEKGSLVKKYRRFSDGLTSTQVFIYDEANNLIEEYFERSDGTTGKAFFQYAEDGRILTSDCEGLNGWLYGLITYRYDSTKRKIAADITRSGKKIGDIYYQYDLDDNLVKEVWNFQQGWNQEFIYEYEKISRTLFSSSNALLSHHHQYRVREEYYDFAGKIGGPSYYYYDLSGKLLRKIFKRSDNFTTNTSYEYQSDGILLHSYRQYSNGFLSRFDYKYDHNKRLISRSFRRSDGLTGSETYTYHPAEYLLSVKLDHFDGWLSGQIRFTHNKTGQLTAGHFIGDQFEAQIKFAYDQKGNCEEIIWYFSDGNIQTYRFLYEKLPTLIKF